MLDYSISYVFVIVTFAAISYGREAYEDNFLKYNLRSSDFAEIATTVSFVDKSSFIKTFLDDDGILVVTAPHQFGKSTNLNMVKRFLEIEVDEEGYKKTKNSNFRDAIRDTDNYNLFFTNKLKITENKTFMDLHFGKHPVIYADFEFDNIHIMSYDIAVDQFRYIIHRSYVEHYYLSKSHRLNSEEKTLVRKWCSTSGYSKMTESDVEDGLRQLSRLLFRHFENQKVFVLIDSFDSPVVNALLFSVTEDIMGGIYRVMTSIIMKVLQKNCYAQRGMISGVSYFAGSPALYSLGYISVSRFLEKHAYAGFHGFTEKEISNMFSKDVFNLSSSMVDKAKSFYGGYESCADLTLYNPWSVINFLITDELRGFWNGPGVAINFQNLLTVPPFFKEIDSMLKGKQRKVTMKKIYAPDDVIRLRDLFRRPDLHMELHSSEGVLTFLQELGYFTYVPNKQPFLGDKVLKIPNKEVRFEISRTLNKYNKNYGQMKNMRQKYII